MSRVPMSAAEFHALGRQRSITLEGQKGLYCIPKNVTISRLEGHNGCRAADFGMTVEIHYMARGSLPQRKSVTAEFDVKAYADLYEFMLANPPHSLKRDIPTCDTDAETERPTVNP